MMKSVSNTSSLNDNNTNNNNGSSHNNIAFSSLKQKQPQPSTVSITNNADRYNLIALIGQGSYAFVYQGWDKMEQKHVAIKIINLQQCDEDFETLHQEIFIMAQLSLPQLTKYYHSYIMNRYDLWIVMEFLEGGSVADMISYSGPLDEKSIAFILHQVLLALDYLHTQQNKIHRDIKAGNILIGRTGDVKLADFGVTTELTETMDKKSSKIG